MTYNPLVKSNGSNFHDLQNDKHFYINRSINKISIRHKNIGDYMQGSNAII